MKNLLLLILILITSLTACTDPLISIPGGKLKGDVVPPPKSWESVPDVIQLEMQPSNPYSINIWGVVNEGDLYVATADSKWVPFILADNKVRVRMEGKIFELTANLVEDVDTQRRVGDAYTEKYNYTADPDEFLDAKLFRLTGRTL